MIDQLASACRRSMEKRSLNKAAVAQQQLEGAISELFMGNWACAITLAGAAEDALPLSAPQDDVFRGVLEFEMKKHNKTEKEIANELNRQRNWLKHHSEKNGDNFSDAMEFEQIDAVFMILRAHSRFVHTTKSKSIILLRFETWFKETHPDWFLSQNTNGGVS